MYGVSTINIELTSRCNKECWMCGRRKLEALDPKWKESLGDMDYNLYLRIIAQVPPMTVVQLHWNGEPTLYPYLVEAAAMAKRQAHAHVCMDTNGLTLADLKRCLEFDSITVSVISDDSDKNWGTQVDQLEQFCEANPTMINLRFLGERIPIDAFENLAHQYGLNIIRRTLHDADMSRNYQKPVVKPEIGVCLDLLHHLAIDIHGDVYPCVRFNPKKINCLGNIKNRKLADISRSKIRLSLIRDHFMGYRGEVPLCSGCDYYGCPVGG